MPTKPDKCTSANLLPIAKSLCILQKHRISPVKQAGGTNALILAVLGRVRGDDPMDGRLTRLAS
jgi:hypothetical protein